MTSSNILSLYMTNNTYTVSDAIKLFKVSRNTIYSWIKDGRLETVKVGRKHYINPTSIPAYMRDLKKKN